MAEMADVNNVKISSAAEKEKNPEKYPDANSNPSDKVQLAPMNRFFSRVREVNYEFHVGDTMYSEISRYQIVRFVGQGTFGKVVNCLKLDKLDTVKIVSVKIVLKNYAWVGKNELAVLKQLQKLDTDKYNLVRLVDNFMHHGHVCLAFEKLHMNLYELMMERSFKPLSLSEIRVIAQQMLVALNALRNMGVAHTDIKPDNIMLVYHGWYPFKLKLIDFGRARPVSKLKCGEIIQTTGYRAPEVILGLPPDAAVDMWSLGCVLAFLLLADHLYPSKYEYEVMRLIVQMLGQPDDRLLNLGLHTTQFFTKDFPLISFAPWVMKPPFLYSVTTRIEISECEGISTTFTGLNDIVDTSGLKDFAEFLDAQAFLSLMKSILCVDPEKRITPGNALEHSFITMDHFGSLIKNNYVKSARLTIKNCQWEQPTAESMLPTDTNNGIQLDEARDNAAGPSYRPAAVTGDRPPAQAGLAEAVPAGNNNNPSHFVKVKTKRKWLNRIRQAFSSSKPPVMSGKDKETTMDNNNGIPSDKATTAGPGYRPETINDRTPASNGNRPPIQTWQDEAAAAAAAGTSNNPSDFVEVKTKHKWLKRIRQAFSSSKPPVMSGKDEETTMDNNNGIPSDEATAAGPSYRPETVTYRTPANNGNRPPIQTWQDEAAAAAAAGTSNNPSDFVKVKTKHKWLKRVRQAFSGMA